MQQVGCETECDMMQHDDAVKLRQQGPVLTEGGVRIDRRAVTVSIKSPLTSFQTHLMVMICRGGVLGCHGNTNTHRQPAVSAPRRQTLFNNVIDRCELVH